MIVDRLRELKRSAARMQGIDARVSVGHADNSFTNRSTEGDLVANIYVGNLSFEVTENELQAVFEEHGQVSAVNIIKDRETGRSRGFAFVEMPDGQQARQAIEAVNLSAINGRNVTVNEARPREDRSRGGRGRRW